MESGVKEADTIHNRPDEPARRSNASPLARTTDAYNRRAASSSVESSVVSHPPLPPPPILVYLLDDDEIRLIRSRTNQRMKNKKSFHKKKKKEKEEKKSRDPLSVCQLHAAVALYFISVTNNGGREWKIVPVV